MGIFDFFRRKNTEKAEPVQEAETSLKNSEPESEPEELQADTGAVAVEEEAAEALQDEKQPEEDELHEEPRQTDPAEPETDNAAKEASQSMEDAAQAEAAPAEAAPAEAAQAEAAPAEPVPAEQKKPTLTPEQIAERKAKQEELTKKRDGEGMVLSYLIQRHHEIRNADSFKSVLESLTTCWLWVPMRMQVSKADALAMEAARKEGRKYAPKDQVRLAPSLIRTKDGQLIFSTYTNRDEIPKDMQKQFIWVQMPSGQCGRNVVANKNINAMVINPTGKSLLLKRELLEKLVKPFQTPEQQNAQDLAAQPDTSGYTS